MKSFLLSAAALIATAVAHPQDLHARDQPVVGLFDVYKLALCVTTGFVDQVKNYQLPNGTCVDTSPDDYNSTFLSYRAGVQGGVPPGDTCYFHVYEEAECKGRSKEFVSFYGNDLACQDALLGTPESGLRYGGKSAAVYCYAS